MDRDCASATIEEHEEERRSMPMGRTNRQDTEKVDDILALPATFYSDLNNSTTPVPRLAYTPPCEISATLTRVSDCMNTRSTLCFQSSVLGA